MCWCSNKKPIFKIADENIIVYKLISKKNTSLHYKYEYKIGNRCYTEISVDYSPTLKRFEINRGFHSYENLDVLYKDWGKVLPSISTIGKFMIPKGSIYVMNKNGEVVSNVIVLIEIVNN